MILFAMLLVAQTASPPPATDDVVVVGQRIKRLERLRMTTKLDRATGVTRCVFRRRSGDRALDAAICKAVLACVPTVQTIEEMRGCVAPTMDALVAQGTAWQADEAKGIR